VTRGSPHAAASEKLSLLSALDAALSAFLSEPDPDAPQIAAVFDRCDDVMARLRKLDAQFTPAADGARGQIPDDPVLAALLEDQRAILLRVTGLIKQAEEKAARLTRDCRGALNAVTRKKWICAQLKDRAPAPGSLLEYSEKPGAPRRKR